MRLLAPPWQRPTPFGTIFSSNITRDAETGIGWWPEEAFRRAMRSGVNRDGQHLYPTFPYDHFTNVTGEDDHALYAYLMSRKPGSFESLKVITAPIRASPQTKDIPPAVTPCRTVAPRSRTRRRRCAGFCSLRPRAVSICRRKLCEPNTARLSQTSGAQQSDDHSHKN